MPINTSVTHTALSQVFTGGAAAPAAIWRHLADLCDAATACVAFAASLENEQHEIAQEYLSGLRAVHDAIHSLQPATDWSAAKGRFPADPVRAVAWLFPLYPRTLPAGTLAAWHQDTALRVHEILDLMNAVPSSKRTLLWVRVHSLIRQAEEHLSRAEFRGAESIVAAVQDLESIARTKSGPRPGEWWKQVKDRAARAARSDWATDSMVVTLGTTAWSPEAIGTVVALRLLVGTVRALTAPRTGQLAASPERPALPGTRRALPPARETEDPDGG